MRWWLTLLMSCATAKPAPPPPAPPPPPKARENAVRLRVSPIDVSLCAKPDAVAPLTRETLAALLELERRRFEPCVPGDADGGVLVEFSVGPSGLAPKGAPSTCLTEAAASLALSSPQPVAASLTLPPAPEAPGLAEARTLRDATAHACACFDGLGVNSPPQLVLIHKPGAPVDVVTAEDPMAARVERCLEEQLAAQPAPSLEVTVDLPLLNADAAADSAKDVSPQVDAAQRLASQQRTSARLGLLQARRAAVLARLSPLLLPLKRKPTPKLMRERTQWCSLLVAIDESLEAAGQPPTTEDGVDPCAGARPAE